MLVYTQLMVYMIRFDKCRFVQQEAYVTFDMLNCMSLFHVVYNFRFMLTWNYKNEANNDM